MTNTNNKISLGLIAGRHPLPVDDFIISGDIADVLDFDLIDKLVKEGLEKVPTKPMISVIGSLDGDVRVEVNCLQCDVDIFGRCRITYLYRLRCRYRRDCLHSEMHSVCHTDRKNVLSSRCHCEVCFEKDL